MSEAQLINEFPLQKVNVAQSFFIVSLVIHFFLEISICNPETVYKQLQKSIRWYIISILVSVTWSDIKRLQKDFSWLKLQVLARQKFKEKHFMPSYNIINHTSFSMKNKYAKIFIKKRGHFSRQNC